MQRLLGDDHKKNTQGPEPSRAEPTTARNGEDRERLEDVPTSAALPGHCEQHLCSNVVLQLSITHSRERGMV